MSSEIGIYCKAYYLKDLRAYPEWKENASNARPDSEVGTSRLLDGESILYLQDNLIVTDGVYKSQHVIFDSVNDAWSAFCKNELNFKTPREVIEAQAAVDKTLKAAAAK